jgi:acyl-CoA synthetase (AMP-forming)/AMP-acid ligase II
MLTALRHNRDHLGGAVAVRTGTPAGWQETSWTELYDATLAAAASAGELLPAGGTAVVIIDGTADSIATVLGLVATGVDVLLLEEKTSYLSDPGSPVHTVGAAVVVGPDGARPEERAADGPTYRTYQQFRATPTGEPVEPAREAEILQLTSGSTGEPRIARVPVRVVLHGARSYQQVFGLGGFDVVLATVPLAHSFGFIGGMATALVCGAELRTLTRFNLRHVLNALGEATMVLGTPLVYQLLVPILRARRGTTAPRVLLSSGGPMAPELAEQVHDALGYPVRQIYGSTETGLIACHPSSMDTWPAGSAGLLAPGVEFRVVAGDRLQVRSPAVFAGYRTGERAPIDADGFYDTGDLVRVDDDGFLFLTGRKETFINVGGRKVNPKRVERILSGHSGVREAFVFGAATATSGAEQQVHAAVVLSEDTQVADVLAFCRAQQLQPYEVPHHVHPMSALPRTGMGKVDRRQIVADATATLGEESHG